ncbi:unnamed protein product [Alternaria alternata]
MSAVNIFLESGCDEVESKDANENTPLMLAIREGHQSIALALLDRMIECQDRRRQHDSDCEREATHLRVGRTADVNVQNEDGDTALDIALEQKMGKVIFKLIEAGANLEYLGRETALVAHAVSSRNTELLSRLIEKKLSLDGAVFFALKDQLPQRDLVLEGIISQLLSAGANTAKSLELNDLPEPEDYDDEDENDGRSDDDALGLASRRGLTSVVEMLLEHGAPAALQNDSGECPLLIATRNGHKDVVRLLLSRVPSSVEMEDQRGNTALNIAVRGDRLEIKKLLLQEGRFSTPSPLFEQCFMDSVRKGATDVLGVMLQRKLLDPDLEDDGKVDPDAKNKNGWTPLSWAAENGHAAVVKLLLDTCKADPNTKDESEWTPLLWAAQNGHTAVVKQLLDTGKADPNAEDESEWTPLLWAARNGHTAVVKQLLDTGKVDPDAKNKNGWTPLLWAAENGHAAVAKQLLDTGKVDPDRKTKNGWTPLLWAAWRDTQ